MTINLPTVGTEVQVTVRYGDGRTATYTGTLTDVTAGSVELTTADSRTVIARRHATVEAVR
jgi:hypothetical protein